tara:strand:- start:133 stop:1014 length:882 start_codon:yes stop_codon:yes gene_type:complete
VKYWKNITINLNGIDLIKATDLLMELNVLSLSIIDKRNKENSDWFHLEGKPTYFDSSTHKISLMINGNHRTEDLLQSVMDILDLDQIPSHNEETIIDRDWVTYSQKNFKEIKISKKLRILPPWLKKKKFSGQTIIIEPGHGFGTGTHPTTKLCLEWISENIKRGDTILDYGSGSGILSIAAKKLGASNAFGIEIDRKAIRNAIYNCKLNNTKVLFYHSTSELLVKKFDVVVSNIISNVLIENSHDLMSFTEKELILCGIKKNQIDKVISEFSDWIKLNPQGEKDGWWLLHGKL